MGRENFEHIRKLKKEPFYLLEDKERAVGGARSKEGGAYWDPEGR